LVHWGYLFSSRLTLSIYSLRSNDFREVTKFTFEHRKIPLVGMTANTRHSGFSHLEISLICTSWCSLTCAWLCHQNSPSHQEYVLVLPTRESVPVKTSRGISPVSSNTAIAIASLGSFARVIIGRGGRRTLLSGRAIVSPTTSHCPRLLLSSYDPVTRSPASLAMVGMATRVLPNRDPPTDQACLPPLISPWWAHLVRDTSGPLRI